jgi:hypothetical protein
MKRRRRRNHTPAFKAKVAIDHASARSAAPGVPIRRFAHAERFDLRTLDCHPGAIEIRRVKITEAGRRALQKG